MCEGGVEDIPGNEFASEMRVPGSNTSYVMSETGVCEGEARWRWVFDLHVVMHEHAPEVLGTRQRPQSRFERLTS